MFNPFSLFEDKDAVTVEMVHNTIGQKENITIIDVRMPDEYRDGHIKGSILLPLPDLSQGLSKLPDKSQKMYVYCRSGSRSARAVSFLRKIGYTDVHNMSGGLIAWRVRGYSLER